MGKLEDGLNYLARSAMAEMDERQEIISHASRSLPGASDDPTRSTLHTGQQFSGRLEVQVRNDGAPDDYNNSTAPEHPQSGPTRAESETRTPAPNATPTNTKSSDSERDIQETYDNSVPSEHFKVANEPRNPTLQVEMTQASDSAEILRAPDLFDTEPTLAAPFAKQDVNHVPEDISLDNAMVAENTQGAVIGNITIVDPDASDTHRFDISDDRFEIVDGQLKLKPGIALNHEDTAQIEVDVTVTDAEGASLTERFTVNVQDVNDAPEAISLDSPSVPENTQGAVIGNITIVDPDTSDTHRFDISDDRFEIVDGQLKLQPGIALNHEDAAQIEVDVTVTDAEGASLTERFTLDVQDVNEGPSRLAMFHDAENLVKNGSFEDFDLEKGKWKGFDADKTGSWKDTNGMEIWDQLGGTKASDGDQLLEMDHGRGIDSISQVINTETGQLYDLSVDLRERLAGGTDTVEVYWNGNLIAELDPQSADWETFQLRVVGTGQDTLELREADGENDTYGALVDNITLTAAEQTVAENVEGAIVGQISFDDPDLSDSHRFEVSDDRFEVVGNQLRLKPGVALDYEEDSSIAVDVTVVDEGGLSLTANFTVNVADMDEITFSSGFHAKFFDVDHRLFKLDDIDWNAEPSHQEVTSDIDFSNGHESFWEGGSKDTFGVQITGNVDVEEGGTFTFFLGADDGAMLVVNGEPVVENDGLHGFRTRSGEIYLEPGTHSIEIRYFENYGRAGLKLEWEGPGLDGRELVTAPDASEAQTVAGMPLAFEVDMRALNLTDETSFELGDLPEGTIVDTGGASYVTDPDGAIELSGWRGEMLTITPPLDFSGTVEASLRHSTPTGEGNSHDAVQKVTFEVNEAALSAPDAKMVGGFHVSYFDVDSRLSKLGDVNWDSEPAHQEFVPEINYKNSSDSFWEGGSKDTFGAKLEGKVTIEEGGSYTFFAGGDDGVAVFINGVEVIDNDGLHGFRTRTGQIELEPGSYNIEVRYFENYGHAGLKLEWDGPDTNRRELLQADPGTAIGKNGTFEVGLELDNASDQAVVSLDGLPAGTLLVSGEDSVITDGGTADLSGWSVDFLEISPPPGFEGSIEGEIIVTDTGFNGAQITSENPFVLEVGQPEYGATDFAHKLAETLSATAGSETPAPWHMDHPQSENEDSDVMAEAVSTNSRAEISCIETDAYERIDW